MNRLFRISWLSIVYLFLYLPIVVLIVNSFNLNKFGFKWGGFSTQWYRGLIENDSLMQAAWHSIIIAVTSASASMLIGSLTAIALFRYRFKGKSLINSMLFIVMMSPDIVMAISFLALFLVIGIHLGFFTLLIAHITFCLPFVVITVYSRLSGFDVKMLEAARDLGASEWVILSRIIFPLAKPAVAAGWLLSFTLSLDDVIISSFVTGPDYEILPLKIYSMVKIGVSPEINALATLMLVVSLILVIISQWLSRDKIH